MSWSSRQVRILLQAVSFPDLTKWGVLFAKDYVSCGEAEWPLTREIVQLARAVAHD